MSLTATQTQTASRPAPQPVDAPCPVPLLALFATALLWLFVGTALALIASLKFHNPHFLAAESWLTYGRVHAAQVTCVLYGFGIPSALGVGLWLLSRLGRTAITGSGVAFIGVLFWNTALLIGLGGILAGDATGFEGFDMPGNVSAMLFAAYLLIAIPAALTFHKREEENLYPSQWFVLGSLFWFPWIFTTAACCLLCMPVRGVMQPIVAWWYAHNFSTIFLGFAGLASIFYFIPKLLGKPLHSYPLAMLAFWLLAFFGSWGGIPDGAPVPSWIVSMSIVGTVFTALPIIAVAMNFFGTAKSNVADLDSNVALRFTYVSLFFWIIAGVQEIVGAIPTVSVLTGYTWYSTAHWELFHYGFFAFAMFGAIYYIVPRLLNPANPPTWAPGLVKAHFGLALFGVLISSLCLIVAGVGQGYLLNDPKNSFADVMRSTMMPFRGSTLGDLFIFIGTVFFLLNFALLLSRHCASCCCIDKKAGKGAK